MPKGSTSSGYQEPKGGMPPTELRALIIEILAGATDQGASQWMDKVGSVETVPIWTNPRSNWRVKGHGSRDERLAIDTAANIVRAQHPYAKG